MAEGVNNISLLLTAVRFCAERHRRQRRKDAEATPFVNHPIEVAELLWHVGEVRNTRVILAALLHDILEDTETQPEEIEERFGKEVLRLVLEVTDNRSLPKRQRKRLQIELAPKLSPGARKIKIADKICNVRDLTLSPPPDWSWEDRWEYLEWTEKVVAGLRGVDPVLEAIYDEVLGEGKRKTAAEKPPDPIRG